MTVRAQGRIAGLVYLAVVLSGIFALAWAPGQLFANDSPTQTLVNLQQHSRLFAAMIAGGVVMSGCFLALPFALARFLRPHGPSLARLMIALVVPSIPFTLLALLQFGELFLLIANDAAALEDLADARAGYRYWIRIATLFWGLWLAPLGWLILSSGCIPRWLGITLLIGSVGYVADSIGAMSVANFHDWPPAAFLTVPASVGELGTCLWLAVFGARDKKLEN